MKKVLIIMAVIIALAATAAPTHAAVDGITKDNYTAWEKTIPDAYGYNKGEADLPYMEGEEYFYNEYTDHWNVDRVYDETLIPADWGKVKADKAKAQKNKKSKKKVKKSKKAKKSKK